MNRRNLLTLADLATIPTRAERRRRVCDGAVYDQLAILRAVKDGAPLDEENRRRFNDDSLAFYRHELDRLDPMLVEPLFSVTWADDIDPLPVAMGEKSTSYIRTKIGSVGTQKVKGLPWINGSANVLPNVSVTGELLTKPLRGLGMEIVVDQFEMAASQLLGRTPIDTQKFDALNVIYQEGIDQMVYVGDEADDVSAKGLVNQPDTVVATANVATGDWFNNATTGGAIVADMQEALRQAWENTAYTKVPEDILLPPEHFALIHTKQMPNINETVYSYFARTCLATQRNRKPINIRPCKWLSTAGGDGTPEAGTPRMVAYTRRRDFLRFPMMAIKRFDPYHLGLAFHSPYAWIFGEVEMPRPETISYWDDLGAAA